MRVLFVDWHRTLSSSPFWERLEVGDSALVRRLTTGVFGESTQLIERWMRGQIGAEEVGAATSQSGLP